MPRQLLISAAKNSTNWLAVGQSKGPARAVVNLGGGVHAETPEQGRRQVGGRDRIRIGIGADGIASPVDESSTGAPAGQHGVVTEWPVVSASICVYSRATAEFTQGDDQ